MFKRQRSNKKSNRKPKRSLRPETLESRQLMTADCIDFEDLALGNQYSHGDAFVADDTGFRAEITLEDFTWASGVTTNGGFARVEDGGLAGGSGRELQVNNTLLRFDFADPVSGMTMKYGEYGGNLNMEINGDFYAFEDFTDIGQGTATPSLGGVEIVVHAEALTGRGVIQFIGNVEQLKIGGQELWIDELCQNEAELQPRFDYGDAPDSYGTTKANFGPAHLIVEDVHLGRLVDPEFDGQPSPNANLDDGNGTIDDEDGVKFSTPIVAGKMADVEVIASTDGWLNAWADFNQDGTWTADEQIFDAEPVTAGVNMLSFSVPQGAVTNETTFTRWRFSNTHKRLEPTVVENGPRVKTPNGEVEDHPMVIRDGEPEPQQQFDFGDAPESYRTTLASNGPRHEIDPDIYLGTSIDAEADGQPSPNAVRDDFNVTDDEDGIRFLTPMIPGSDAKVEVTASEDGWLNAWVDFNRDGSFDPSTEAIASAEFIPIGTTVLTFTVPELSDVDPHSLIYSRFRFSSNTKLLGPAGVRPDGSLPNGEVEDYAYLNGDVDGDFDRDVDDVDAMSQAIKNGGGDLTDLNCDGTTDHADMDMLIEEIFATYRGDADLDGDVDFSDFLQLTANFGKSPDASWADGDFDSDCEVGFSDFLLMSANFGNA